MDLMPAHTFTPFRGHLFTDITALTDLSPLSKPSIVKLYERGVKIITAEFVGIVRISVQPRRTMP